MEITILILTLVGTYLFFDRFHYKKWMKYYRNEIQQLFDSKLDVINQWNQSLESWNETIKELVLRGNKILELINSMNILKNQNVRYSKICRRLYDENQSLNKEIEASTALFKLRQKNLELKIAELENKKKRKKG